MANFNPIFKKVIDIEGGYHLHEVDGDRGGMTYAGIARNKHPLWVGWAKIDIGQFDNELKSMVYAFFKHEFWDRIRGDNICSQVIAYHIYAFSVNTGRRASVKIAQRIIGAKIDGACGPKTIHALNTFSKDEKDEQIFILRFSLDKVFLFKDICLGDKRRKKDKVVSNLKFLPGWINRVQRGLE